MKIDFSRPIPALDGTDRKDGEKPWLLRDACVLALDRTPEDEIKKLEPKDKYHRGDLARRIYGSKEPLAIDAEDVTMLKALVAKMFLMNIVIAELWDMLDPSGK